MAFKNFQHFVRLTLKGKKGDVLTVQQKPGALFRGESMQATDDSPARGRSTRVVAIAVGAKTQVQYASSHVWLPPLLGARSTLAPLSVEFVLGNRLETCEKELPITVQVEFLEDCTWCASIAGTAASDDEVKSSLQAQKLAAIPSARTGNALTAEELVKLAAQEPALKVPGAAELFALVYAGCEADAIFRPTGKPFRGIVQGFVNQGSLQGSILLGTVGRPRAANESDITWTVEHPLGGWHICRVVGAKVSTAGKACGVIRASGAYSACSRPLGHVGDHVSVGLGTLRFSERWPQAQPEVLYRGEMMETEAPKRRFCGYCHKASPTLVCQRKYGHKDQHIRHDRCGNGSATSCFGPKGHEGPCEWATWKGDDRETTPVTVDLSPVTPIVLPLPTQRLLQMVCGLPPRCLTRPQREELRLLERQLQRALHLKDTLEYKKQHQLLRRVEGETANEQFTRFTAAADVAAWTAVLGEGMKKEPSLADLAMRMLVLAGQICHEFLSVKQSRELIEGMRKLRSVLVL